MRRWRRRLQAWSIPLGTVVVLIIVWQLAVNFLDVRSFILPSPGEVLDGFADVRDTLPRHTWATLRATLVGYFVSIVIGVPLAVAIVYSPFLEKSIYPLLVGMQAVPKVAIAPIAVIWFGFGLMPKVVIVFLVAFFPIVISTASGLKSTPPEYMEMIRSFEATPLQVFRRVRFPAALPSLFVGLKIAISLAVIGAVIGEFVGATEGLGYLISISRGNVRTDIAFAAIIVLGVLSVVLYYILVALERWVVPWGEQRVQPM